MKRTMVFIIMYGCGIIFAKAQAALVPDQNPNYRDSQEKYMRTKDSLLASSNTTVQETYKAYDWYQARQERREDRREARRWNNYSYDYYGYGGYNGLNGYYNPGFGYPLNNNWWLQSFRPNIGYRTGNWFFGF